jgi:hypothetical protein
LIAFKENLKFWERTEAGSKVPFSSTINVYLQGEIFQFPGVNYSIAEYLKELTLDFDHHTPEDVPNYSLLPNPYDIYVQYCSKTELQHAMRKTSASG